MRWGPKSLPGYPNPANRHNQFNQSLRYMLANASKFPIFKIVITCSNKSTQKDRHNKFFSPIFPGPLGLGNDPRPWRRARSRSVDGFRRPMENGREERVGPAVATSHAEAGPGRRFERPNRFQPSQPRLLWRSWRCEWMQPASVEAHAIRIAHALAMPGTSRGPGQSPAWPVAGADHPGPWQSRSRPCGPVRTAVLTLESLGRRMAAAKPAGTEGGGKGEHAHDPGGCGRSGDHAAG
jgi:hypothetical protein